MYKHEHKEESWVVGFAWQLTGDRATYQGGQEGKAVLQLWPELVLGPSSQGVQISPDKGQLLWGSPASPASVPLQPSLVQTAHFTTAAQYLCARRSVCRVRVEHHLWVCRNWYSHPDRLSIPACCCQSLRAHPQVHLEHNLAG